MRKLFVLCLAIFFSLAGCQKEGTISLDDVLNAFEKQQLHLEESKERKNDSIFGAKLYGEKPKTYLLNNNFLYVFIYDSSADRSAALEAFQEKTAAMNLMSFSIYEKDNILIFYVYENDIKNTEFDTSMKEALHSL